MRVWRIFQQTIRDRINRLKWKRRGLPAFAYFRNIEVVPTANYIAMNNFVDGGPVWPEFDRQTAVRHRYWGEFLDVAPQPVAGPHLRLSRPCIWGGYARNHFGHTIAENNTRVLWSIVQRPDDLVLFVTQPEGRGRLGDFFWVVNAWYGLPRTRIRLVDKPLMVADLRVMPQAEHLPDAPPPEVYLDLLDENTARNKLIPVQGDLLYVGRPGLIARGKAGHAGEAYLIARLQALGIRTLDPATTPLRDQLALYAGARCIVFAEGSAVHGRQLLGRIAQDIVVLNRRAGGRMAEGNLKPRLARVRYVEAARHDIMRDSTFGVVHTASALAYYDIAVLFKAFRALGVDLERGWNQIDYVRERDADTVAWLAHRPELFTPGRRIDAQRVFAAEGLEHLLNSVKTET